MSKEDGGPAYPVTPTDRSGQIGSTEWGMSLRDWLAGMAMQGLLAAQIHGLNDKPSNGPFASLSFDMADAMIAERDKEDESH